MYGLEHVFIANGDAKNIVRAVGLDRIHDDSALPRVCNTAVRLDEVTEVDGHVDFGLLDRLKLWTVECVKG